MVRRNYIFDTIRSAFQKYGYLPIETPAMEKTETLMGKYGEEGDKLLFRILSRGKKLENVLTNDNVQESDLNEEALRYDLTVPFARFVVMHQNELSFPFKRYQIQPVWRADRPQKGRYREFYQCDADVVGSDSLLYEVELVQIYDQVLSELQIPDFTIKINNRKILSGIAEVTGETERLTDMTVAIDKLDKIGEDGVVKELEERGIEQTAIDKLTPLFHLNGDNADMLSQMANFLADSETGTRGVEELRFVLDTVHDLGLNQPKLEFDVTLARGLNYYTGAIFEVKANGVKIGSICGGGRYDDLTGVFGREGLSGVGISFGADRIYDVLEELNLFPECTEETTQLLIVNFGDQEAAHCLKLLKEIRKAGINAEIYPDSAKMKKQMKYADQKAIPFVALVGQSEIEEGVISLKDMATGTQENLTLEALLIKIGKHGA